MRPRIRYAPDLIRESALAVVIFAAVCASTVSNADTWMQLPGDRGIDGSAECSSTDGNYFWKIKLRNSYDHRVRVQYTVTDRYDKENDHAAYMNPGEIMSFGLYSDHLACGRSLGVGVRINQVEHL